MRLESSFDFTSTEFAAAIFLKPSSRTAPVREAAGSLYPFSIRWGCHLKKVREDIGGHKGVEPSHHSRFQVSPRSFQNTEANVNGTGIRALALRNKKMKMWVLLSKDESQE